MYINAQKSKIMVVSRQDNISVQVDHERELDPSAAPPPLFRLASGCRAGAPTKIRLAVAGDFSGGGGGGGIRRKFVTSWTEAHHIISEPKYGTCSIYS